MKIHEAIKHLEELEEKTALDIQVLEWLKQLRQSNKEHAISEHEVMRLRAENRDLRKIIAEAKVEEMDKPASFRNAKEGKK